VIPIMNSEKSFPLKGDPLSFAEWMRGHTRDVYLQRYPAPEGYISFHPARYFEGSLNVEGPIVLEFDALYERHQRHYDEDDPHGLSGFSTSISNYVLPGMIQITIEPMPLKRMMVTIKTDHDLARSFLNQLFVAIARRCPEARDSIPLPDHLIAEIDSTESRDKEPQPSHPMISWLPPNATETPKTKDLEASPKTQSAGSPSVSEIAPSASGPPPRPAEPSTEDPLSEWFDWYHECKKTGYKVTLQDVADRCGYSLSTVKKEHILYKAERGLE
jgi:hypothetical protein